MSEKIESYKDLNVYRSAFELQQKIYDLTKKFPKEEIHSLTDRIRRASRSVGAAIAEAWQKRRDPDQFLGKLSDADREQAGTRHWLDTSLTCGYVTEREHEILLSKCTEIGRMLGKMMSEPEKWCGKFNR